MDFLKSSSELIFSGRGIDEFIGLAQRGSGKTHFSVILKAVQALELLAIRDTARRSGWQLILI
jgi:hypothetical protein